MKHFHPLSFGLGLGTGALVFLLILGGMRVFGGPSSDRPPFDRGGLDRPARTWSAGADWQQMRRRRQEDAQRVSASGASFPSSAP